VRDGYYVARYKHATEDYLEIVEVDDDSVYVFGREDAFPLEDFTVLREVTTSQTVCPWNSDKICP
jgi:hypothetical protein